MVNGNDHPYGFNGIEEGGCSDRNVNCHSYVWHNSKGDPTDERNKDEPIGWDASPSDDLGGWREMDFEEPNVPGDRVIYFLYNPHTKKNEMTHSGLVIDTDDKGNTTLVISKWGAGHTWIHHPRDISPLYGKETPTYKAFDGNIYISRIYFRKKKIDRINKRRQKKGLDSLKSY